MAIRRVTGAVSPSELIFADANALGATYDGTGTTIERGETFTLPAGGTTAVSNGALRLEALKGDCTITNNGNSTLTNASGVDGTIVMRSGASDFPAFVRNSSMGSMSTPAREDFTGDVSGTVSGTINSNATFPKGIKTETNYLIKQLTANVGNNTNAGYQPSAGNNIVFPFDTILANTTDSAFTQNILSVSSGYFTLNTGYYNWKLYIPLYGNDHVISHGLRTYGASDGSGSSLGSIKNDDVNFMAMGTTYNKSGYATHAHSNEGIVKVTSNTQKYCVTFYFETSNYAAFNNSSVFQVSASNPQNQGFIRIDKIGAI